MLEGGGVEVLAAAGERAARGVEAGREGDRGWREHRRGRGRWHEGVSQPGRARGVTRSRRRRRRRRRRGRRRGGPPARARAEEERARRRATGDGGKTMRRCAAKDSDGSTRIGVDAVAVVATNKIGEDLAEEEEGDGLYRQGLWYRVKTSPGANGCLRHRFLYHSVPL